jgi:uncharacterized phage protein (TIGR01671 family)
MRMREINFRGRRIDNKEWVYGFVSYNKLGEAWIRVIDNENMKVTMYEVDIETVGQFTGVLDKEGKKVYEGDIVENKGFKYPCVVIFNEVDCSFDTKSIKTDMEYGIGFASRVIGDIYNNPDLIGG